MDQRRRSFEMYQQLEQEEKTLRAYQVVQLQGKRFIVFPHQVPLCIVDGNITNMAHETTPFISIGMFIDEREWILLNQSSPYLIKLYDELQDGIKTNKIDESERLNYAINFVKNHFTVNATEEEIEKEIKKIVQANFNVLLPHPIISLDTFLQKKIGICRHHALFMCYLLSNLIHDGLIPSGHIFHHRSTIRVAGEEVGHAWAMYKPIQSIANNYTIYSIDSLNSDVALILAHDQEILSSAYGETAVLDCLERYNKFNSETDRYEITAETIPKNTVIRSLLFGTLEQRRKILNDQHALEALININADLNNKDSFVSIKYHTHPDYLHLCKDVARVLNTENLLRIPYSRIRDQDDRQQFILGLLYKSKEQQKTILNNLTRYDLDQIKNSLHSTKSGRSEFYNSFESYPVLLLNVDKCIESKPRYSELLSATIKNDFIQNLLKQHAKERTAILYDQNMPDLKGIKKFLQHYKTQADKDTAIKCDTILREIHGLMMANVISMIEKIILSGNLTTQSSQWSARFIGAKVKTVSGDINIPKSSLAIHTLISEAKIDTGDTVKSLEQLLEAVRTQASIEVAKKKKFDPINAKKHEFLHLLSTIEDPTQLYKELNDFYNDKIKPSAGKPLVIRVHQKK